MTMLTIRHETTADVTAREALLDAAFGPTRRAKTAERLRERRLPADNLSFVATEHGQVVGTVRMWSIATGDGRPALLLGPLAIAGNRRNQGIGSALMDHAMHLAQRLGHTAVLLVGDAPYYGRFGFSAEKTGALWLPGPYDRDRLLGCELVAGALDGATGPIEATGRRDRRRMTVAPQRRAA
jgi:predicted N-acetyltransferase YhbS